jgi:hypothetical protein
MCTYNILNIVLVILIIIGFIYCYTGNEQFGWGHGWRWRNRGGLWNPYYLGSGGRPGCRCGRRGCRCGYGYRGGWYW